jgi:hypothetical protein
VRTPPYSVMVGPIISLSATNTVLREGEGDR